MLGERLFARTFLPKTVLKQYDAREKKSPAFKDSPANSLGRSPVEKWSEEGGRPLLDPPCSRIKTGVGLLTGGARSDLQTIKKESIYSSIAGPPTLSWCTGDSFHAGTIAAQPFSGANNLIFLSQQSDLAQLGCKSWGSDFHACGILEEGIDPENECDWAAECNGAKPRWLLIRKSTEVRESGSAETGWSASYA